MPVYSSDQFKDHVASQPPAPDGRTDIDRAVNDPDGQLVLFAPAGELKDAVTPLDSDHRYLWDEALGAERKETRDEMWGRKTFEAIQYGLADSIEHHGVQKPIRISPEKGLVMNGHHRISAAADIEKWKQQQLDEDRSRGLTDETKAPPMMVPVTWDKEEGMNAGTEVNPYLDPDDPLPNQRNDGGRDRLDTFWA